MKLKSINPFNNQLIEEFKEHSEKDLNIIIEKAAAAFLAWRFSSFHERATCMMEASEILLKNKEKYALTTTLEMGKPITESVAEVEKCAWLCRYYSAMAKDHLKPEIIKTDASMSRVQYEPLGTILGIMPWNFPFWQVFRFLAPTIMAGNTALLKHASNVQRCALHINDIMKEAGFPEGVFSVLLIGSSRVENVIRNDYIKAISLTGSEYAGSKVAALAGSNIKKTVLELGGSNAFIVLDDADLDLAVDLGIKARFQNCGQSCIAAKRFFIHKKVATEFLSNFKKSMEALRVGNPLEEHTNLGPLASMAQAEILERQVEDSIYMGAKAVNKPKHKESFYYPLLLTDVKPGMPVFDEEVFGPVAPIMTFDNEQEAVELSNQTKFGLGVSIFTSNISRAEKLIPYFEDGAVFINELVKSDPRLSFGGTKKSGYGRELSLLGIREFVNAKTVYFR